MKGIFKIIWWGLFLIVFLVPESMLFLRAFNGDGKFFETRILESLPASVAVCLLTAFISVALGIVSAKIIAQGKRGSEILLVLLVCILVMPRYLLYYAWSLILQPQSSIGKYIISHGYSENTNTLIVGFVIVAWYWPVAALLCGQWWRNIDWRIFESSKLESTALTRFFIVTLPSLAPGLVGSFLVCFILSFSEFTTFHLAGIKTVGTELGVIYDLTGNSGDVVRAAFPVVLISLLPAIVLTKGLSNWNCAMGGVYSGQKVSKREIFFVLFLFILSGIIPILLLCLNLKGLTEFEMFFKLHASELLYSMMIGSVSALICYIIAWGIAENFTVKGKLSKIVVVIIFSAMFLPGSILASALLESVTLISKYFETRNSWILVSVGHASRFCGMIFILLSMMKISQGQSISEMARCDGAGIFTRLRYITIGRNWRMFIGGGLLVMMFSMTEVASTMLLLPPGVPSIGQWLLNQMHYAREQQVIATCLILVATFLFIAIFSYLLIRTVYIRRSMLTLLFAMMISILVGCDNHPVTNGKIKEISIIGNRGRGNCEFIYPRAISYSDEIGIVIIDKTGRVQRLNEQGVFLNGFDMPEFKKGKPTGISISPDNDVFVADTHYHRIVSFSPEGQMKMSFGKYGEQDGEFIYPTDVEFGPDGRIYVGEYGGNDRVSVFDQAGNFLFKFGEYGNGLYQFSRPAAICIDENKEMLYIADACNHRIGVYDLEGEFQKYIGSLGSGPGQLRYPYDLCVLNDGSIVVCEFGNNRVQVFNKQGQSIAIYGSPGRDQGQLAYPWGVASAKDNKKLYVVDSGNNRIQVWKY